MQTSRPVDHTIRVLHIDDESDFSELCAIFLSKFDDRIEVRTTTDPAEAPDIIVHEDIHCVVSDFDMPHMDGLDLLRAVRNQNRIIPFILFTGKGSEEIASEAISEGVSDYLQKGGTETFELLGNRVINAVREFKARKFEVQTNHDPVALLDWMPDAYIALDEAYRFTYVNAAAEDLLGESELLGEQIWEVFPEAVDTTIYDQYHETVEGGHPRVIEEYFEPWDRWYREHLYPTEHGLSILSRDITEQKEGERRFEAVFNNSHSLVWLLDPDGNIREVNQTALSFRDGDRKDATGTPLSESAWFTTNQAAVRRGIAIAARGDVYHDTIREPDGDGETTFDFSVRPIRDVRGEVSFLVPEARDVTKQLEHVRRLETLVDNVPGMVYQCRNEAGWTMLQVDGQVRSLTGYAPEDIVSQSGMFGHEIIHEDDRDRVWEMIQSALATQSRFEVTYRIVTQSGEIKRVLDRGQGIDAADGPCSLLEGIIIDIESLPIS